MDINKLIKQEKLESSTVNIIHAINFINGGNSIIFYGLPRSGISTNIAFLNKYFLNFSDKFEVIFDEEGNLTLIEIKKIIEKVQNKKVLLLLPYLIIKNQSYISELDELLFSNKNSAPIIVSYGSLNMMQNPFDYFKRSINIIKNPICMKVLDLKQTKLNIQRLRELYGFNIPQKIEKKILHLSGGNIGLMKRVCQHYSLNGNLHINQLLISPPMIFSIEEILHNTKGINDQLLNKIGLIDESGKYISLLINNYINKNNDSFFQLEGKMKKLFNLFIENKNLIVSLEEIENALSDNTENTLWSAYKSISRLRKITTKNYKILSLKGKGYMLKLR